MSIELQIRATALAGLMSRSVQDRLRSTCLPVFSGFSIDHLEVVPGAAVVQAIETGVVVQLPLDVYIVEDAALMAAPNATPAGATVPARRVDLAYQVGVELEPLATVAGLPTRRALLTLTPGSIDLGQGGGLLGPAAAGQLLPKLPTLRLDLTPALTTLGLPAPDVADVVLVDEVVAVRFNPTAAPRAELVGGQEWGLFVAAQTLEAMVRQRIGRPLQQAAPQVSFDAHYEAVAGAPRVGVKLTLSARFDALDLEARIEVDIGVDLTLIPRPIPTLRLAIDWSFHVFADGVPGFVENAVESLAEGLVTDLVDPALFGGTRTGDRSFVIDQPLPFFELPGVRLSLDTLPASDDGMTLGGAVHFARINDQPFSLTVHRLSSPLRIQLCSELARTGSGARSAEPPSIHNTKSFAEVDIEGCGALCAVDQRTPATPLAAYLAMPALGNAIESVSLRYAMPYAVAMTLGQPLTLVVRTPRGVRLVDLGMAPKVDTDEHGVLLGRSRDYYIKDCLSVVPGSGAGAGWGTGVDGFRTRPMEEPDWSAYLHQAGGLIVQLATVTGLDARELLRFRSATHAIDVTADARGSALVPVMMPLAASIDAARLVRADGRSLEGRVHVDSAVFERHLTLPGTLASPIALSRSGSLLLTTRSRRATLAHSVTSLGVSTRVLPLETDPALNPQPLPPPAASDGLAALNPQPLPPVESPEATRAWGERLGLRGLAQVLAIPGHEESGAAIAVLTDGTKLMLDLRHGAEVRVAGTFAGPIGALASVGRWSVADAGLGRDVAVFSVRRSEPSPTPRGWSGCRRCADTDDALPCPQG